MEKQYNDVAVYTTRIAKALLKLNYTIVNIGANNNDPTRTVFYFRNENSIQTEILKLQNRQ